MKFSTSSIFLLIAACSAHSGFIARDLAKANPAPASSGSPSNSNSGPAEGSSNSGSSSSSGSSFSSSKQYSSEYGVLQFENLGFPGTYQMVSKIDSSSDDACTCELNSDPISFSGTNAPLNEELSVHIRGPLNLQKFAYFVSDSYSSGDTSGSWSRLAYYDSSSGTADNVTFLGNVGTNITCLGNALDYVDSDGVSQASESTVLGDVTLVSNEEFVIMSNVSCDSSGYDNDCGVYRDGIPAYHGYYGTVKMFLFEFMAPTEDSVDEDTASYNMPAIWLLNANIPRTAQYPTNENCSCWTTGCGEFDIFEVMNSTEGNHFYSTIHDYQGTGDIGTGLPVQGFLERTPDSVMKGGVVFGSDGSATVFLSNDTTFDDGLLNSDLEDWISGAEDDGSVQVDTLNTITAASSTSSSFGNSLFIGDGFFWKFITLFITLFSFF